jgi:hypothetical protein
MSIQPYTGNQTVVLEKRDAAGKLDFSGEQPPTSKLTFDGVYQLFFKAVPDGVGSWEQLSAWLKSKGWTIRARIGW